MIEVKPIPSSTSRWRGSGAASSTKSGGSSAISCGSPLRITCGEPTGESMSSG
jgi:hypothetical protein